MPSDAESVVVFKLFAIKLLYKTGQRDGPMIAGRLTTHGRLAEQRLKLCCGDFPISEAVNERFLTMNDLRITFQSLTSHTRIFLFASQGIELD